MYIFYGELRAVEEQHTVEKLWYSGTEILFLVAVFSSELIQVHYALIFTFVWLVKSLHWVADDRVDLLFTSQSSDWSHIRYLATLATLCTVDVLLLRSFYSHISFTNPPSSPNSIWVIFSLEIGLVLNSLALCHNKYLILLHEQLYLRRYSNEEQWVHKKNWLFFAEAACDLIQIAMFCIFFVLISPSKGMPIFKFRDAIVCLLNFISRVKEFYNYLVVARRMDSFTYSPTLQDLIRNTTCIICFEEMELVLDPKQLIPKKLACGHVLHLGCLKHWLERSKLCPTCRRDVFDQSPSTLTSNNVNVEVDWSFTSDNHINSQGATVSSQQESIPTAWKELQNYIRQSATLNGVPEDWIVLPARRNKENDLEIYTAQNTWSVVKVK